MTYGIQLDHQSPPWRRRHSRNPLWYAPGKGEGFGNGADQILDWTIIAVRAAAFATEQEAREQIAKIAPYVTARIAPLA